MKFLTGKELSDGIEDIIYNTEKYLLIISPFIQLDKHFKNEVFKTLLNNSKVHIIIGFGKNENDINKSFKEYDIEFFTQFPNISIVYLPTLHGKYYGNEKKATITSINLIDYSFKNNIEFGVLTEKRLLSLNKFFYESQNKCFEIIEDGFTIFVRRPNYEKKIFSKNYLGSDVDLDIIDELVRNNGQVAKKNFSDYRNEKNVNAKKREVRKSRVNKVKKISNSSLKGHCIRCKSKIKLNLKIPFCKHCYGNLKGKIKPKDKEIYCIDCGKKDDSISFKSPACYPCYSKNHR